MDLLRSIRGLMKSQPDGILYWKTPKNTDEIDAILRNESKPQLIYKHSNRCGVSILSRNSLDSGMESITEQADSYMIDVVAMRDLSNYVADKTGVKHESPQLILINNGEIFWDASHGDVRIEKLLEALEGLQNVNLPT